MTATLAAGGFGVFDPGINALSILGGVLPCSPLLHDATLHIPANREAPIVAQLEMTLPHGVRVDVAFDFLESGPQRWDIEIDTDDGRLLLSEGGQLRSNRTLLRKRDDHDYARLYSRFVELIAARASDVDVTPLRLVAGAFLLGRRVSTAALEF